MGQQRLFHLAVEAMHLHAVYVAGEGWRCRVTYRRQDEPWSDAYSADYARMSAGELTDTLCEEVARALGTA